MPTTIDKSLLEKNISEINFGSLDPFEELRKINPRFMEAFDRLKGAHQTDWLKSYAIESPVEETLIQIALDKIAPVKLSATEEDKVRRAMAAEAAKGIEIDSPAKEAEWEAKIQEARMKDKQNMETIKADRAKQYAGIPLESGDDNDGLSAIKGLGDKSIEKLQAAGIKTVAAFNELSNEHLQEIVGPLVASKFRK